MGESIVLRPSRPLAVVLAGPSMSLGLLVPLAVAAGIQRNEWGSASAVVMLGLLSRPIGWRRFRIRLVADACEVLVFNTFRTWHIPWSMIVAFNVRPQRPWRWRSLAVFLDDGTAITSEATMNWPRRQELLDRCADLEQLRLSIVGDAPGVQGH